MTTEQYLKNLNTPTSPVDVVLDTDAYNEIDDQFAISYMLRSKDRLHVKGLCAAPFLNSRSASAADGMEKSYQEIFKLLELAEEDDLKSSVYRGSDSFMADEKTPVISDAATYLAELAKEYSPEHPLYIVAIGAITNVASAILMNPDMKENTVIVWLGGHGVHLDHTREFNMYQDVAAARIVFGCGVPLVQLPCGGIVDHFVTSRYELEHWLLGKNKLCNYLVQNTIEEAESYAKGRPWTRVIWDVTAVAWLLNDDRKFMTDCLIHSPIPEYDDHYGFDNRRHFIKYVSSIKRDALFADLFEKLSR
ncbi:MAG: nucleoside hydrolase [Lachnospiraceae bacterium]|nr:nucleoside hydrolase [Lachnospiraceae bacterium]